jgi:hypothetical protein
MGIYCHVLAQQYGTYLDYVPTTPNKPINQPISQI